MNFEVIEILDSVLNSKGRKLKKQNEYMYWSPFVSHHKPKLQVNIETGKWHCWVSNQGGHNLFQLLKRIGASRTHYQKLSEIVGDTRYVKKEEKEYTLKLPEEFIIKPFSAGRSSWALLPLPSRLNLLSPGWKVS